MIKFVLCVLAIGLRINEIEKWYIYRSVDGAPDILYLHVDDVFEIQYYLDVNDKSKLFLDSNL